MRHNVAGDPISFHQPVMTPTLRMYRTVPVSRAYDAWRISNQQYQTAKKMFLTAANGRDNTQYRAA
jgi:hypothetical protein